MPIDELNEQKPLSIEETIEQLRAEGLADEEILANLEQLLRERKISEEDYAKAQELLRRSADAEDDEEDEKKKAEKLFGVNFIN